MYEQKLENNNSDIGNLFDSYMDKQYMNRAIILLTTLLLGGCVTGASLIAKDGPRYPLDVNRLSKSMSANVDGVRYQGRFVMDRSIGIGSTQTNAGSLQATSFGSMMVAGSNGEAILTGNNGGYIECSFKANGPTAVGRCQSNEGRQFVLTTD